MKRLLVLTLIMSFVFPFFGCFEEEVAESSEVSESSAESSEESSKSEISVFVPEEEYPFLTSKYVVSSKTRFHDTTYSYRYYLVKGRVVGATQTISLPDEKTAKEYHAQILKEYPDAMLMASSVTVFLEGKKLGQYNNCSLNKLKFILETEEREYSVSFDEEDFLDRYSGVISD